MKERRYCFILMFLIVICNINKKKKKKTKIQRHKSKIKKNMRKLLNTMNNKKTKNKKLLIFLIEVEN